MKFTEKLNLDLIRDNLYNATARFLYTKNYFLTVETLGINTFNAYRTITENLILSQVTLLLDPSNDYTFEHDFLIIHSDLTETKILEFNDGTSYQNVSISGKNHELNFKVSHLLVAGDKLCYRIAAATTTYLYTSANFEVHEY